MTNGGGSVAGAISLYHSRAKSLAARVGPFTTGLRRENTNRVEPTSLGGDVAADAGFHAVAGYFEVVSGREGRAVLSTHRVVRGARRGDAPHRGRYRRPFGAKVWPSFAAAYALLRH